MNQDEHARHTERPPRVCSTLPASALAFGLSRGIPAHDLEDVTGLPVVEIISATGHIADDLPPRIMKSIAQSNVCDAPALEMAKVTPVSMLGGMERAAAYAPTGRAAVEVFRDHAKTLADRTTVWMEETDTFLSVHFTHPLDVFDDGLTHETHVTLVWRFLRYFLGRNAELSEVGFGFSAHGSQKEYRDMFDAPVRFGRQPGEHLLVFKKAALEAENANYNHVLFETGRLHLQETARQLERDVVCRDFRRLLTAVSSCAARNEFAATAVASDAGMTLRSAQRIAAKYGASLRDLIEAERVKRAKLLMLGAPSIRLNTVAAELGYSDERAFRRFFKRRVGIAPGEYQAMASPN